MIKVFNTLKGKIEEFKPIDNQLIKVYVCGPTVYDKIHIGNARPLVVFDVLIRLLKFIFPKVIYVRNITDVDDKINLRSIESGISINELTKNTIKKFHEDCNYLQNIIPDYEPKATEHIDEMIAMIKDLINMGFAYESSGNILFEVEKYKGYGSLSRKSPNDLISGVRIDIAEYKKNPADFILWKPSIDNQPGWESPWGRGRPGWHIECSAMSKKYLGPHFDIHGGGLDLVFPHHENEIAQSCCANKTELMANYWMHNGYVNIDNKKMSKSKDNFINISDILKNFHGEIIRYLLLQTHYRAPLNFKYQYLNKARSSLYRLYRAVEGFKVEGQQDDKILKFLADDLNTPKVLARAHFLAEQSNKGSKEAGQLLKNSSSLLGFLNFDTDHWFKNSTPNMKLNSNNYKFSSENIEKLINQRILAKKEKNFKLADDIRKTLLEDGVVLEDSVDGTNWRRS